MLAWLGTKLSRWGAEADEPSDPESVGPTVDESTGDAANETHFELRETNAPMPDIYADEHDAAVSDVKVLGPASPDTDNSIGFNPYDTAVLQKK